MCGANGKSGGSCSVAKVKRSGEITDPCGVPRGRARKKIDRMGQV